MEKKWRTYRVIFRREVVRVCEATGERTGTGEYEYATVDCIFELPVTEWHEKNGCEFEIIGGHLLVAAGEKEVGR
jgi:hypothetical protein